MKDNILKSLVSGALFTILVVELYKGLKQTDGKMETEPIIINAKVSSIIKDEGKHATMGFSCVERNIAPRRYLRGDHWILFNHIEAKKKFKCHETVTLTTQCTQGYMKHLINLAKHWDGLISVAVYAPGTDYYSALDEIAFLRHCYEGVSAKILDIMSFSIIIPEDHLPDKIFSSSEIELTKPNCSLLLSDIDMVPLPKLANITYSGTYRLDRNLDFPINTARNVAREAASSHWILQSDNELIPSPGLAPKFLDMIAKGEESALARSNPRVFVVPAFDIDKDHPIPTTKKEFVKLYEKKVIVPFGHGDSHFSALYAEDWMKKTDTDELRIYGAHKRTQAIHKYWEPFFIGTHSEPKFEERHTWEGKDDKTDLAFRLCLMDYDFMILDNAFLLHNEKHPRTGPLWAKWLKTEESRLAIKFNTKLTRAYVKMYGNVTGCISKNSDFEVREKKDPFFNDANLYGNAKN